MYVETAHMNIDKASKCESISVNPGQISENGYTIIIWNITGLAKKQDSLGWVEFINEHDVICMHETWCTPC